MNRMMRVAPAALALALTVAFAAPARIASAVDTATMTMEPLKDADRAGKKQLVADNMTRTAATRRIRWTWARSTNARRS